MKALISPNEQVNGANGYLGQRIAQVEPNENIFPVAPPLYWLDCNDDVNASEYYFDNNDDLIKKIPNQEQELIDATEIVY